jgi:hypothetical protein
MEIEDLKTAWQEMERRLEQSESLNRQLVAQVKVDKARSALRWFGLAQAIELAFWFALVIFVAPFWIAHRGTPHLLVSGLVLHLYGIAAICLGVTQLLQYARVHYAGPVLDVQKRLAELHRMNALSALLLGLPWAVLWVPLAIVAAKAFLGLDLWNPRWVAGSVSVGLVIIAAVVAYARRELRHGAGSPRRQRILDALAGCSLTRAQRHLDEIARFASR